MILLSLSKRPFTAAACVAGLLIASAAQAQVSFDWAEVGNAGNAYDDSFADPYHRDLGAVAYDYRIATTEVTNAQYTQFLNAVAATDTYLLYNTEMANNLGGITRSGSPGSYTYSATPGRENHPVNYVNWFDAARFANWMTNGQGNGDTESGVYTLLYNPSDSFRDILVGITRDLSNPNQVFLPTENEWYKAAYHDASAGTAAQYFNYATANNSAPVSNQPGDDPAAVNYFNDDGLANGFNDGFAVSGTTVNPELDPDLPGGDIYPLTDVGAYTDAPSPYGTFDQNGNVSEFMEDSIFGTVTSRTVRGGSWRSGAGLRSDSIVSGGTNLQQSDLGFRVAASPVPEPGSLALLGVVAGLMLRRRCG